MMKSKKEPMVTCQNYSYSTAIDKPKKLKRTGEKTLNRNNRGLLELRAFQDKQSIPSSIPGGS
jgi:hypothetical protein